MSDDGHAPEDEEVANGVIGRIERPGDDGEQPEVEPERVEGRPPRRRRSLAIGCLLALLGVLLGGGLAFLLARQRAKPPAAEVSAPASSHAEYVAELVFSAKPERPEATPDVIPSEAAAIYCFYELSRLPPDAPLRARWWHKGEAMGDLPLADHERTGEDHATGRFAIAPPSGQDAFPPGIYEVELSSPAEPSVSVRASFVALPRAAKILAGGGEPDQPLIIRDLQTALAVTEEGKPSEVAHSFRPDAGRIYACFSYQGMAPGGLLVVRWHAGEVELTKARSELTVSAPEGWAHAWLELGAGERLPEGQYQVTVHLGEDAEPLASLGFTVEAEGEPASGS